MAERGFTPVIVNPVFKNKSLSAGDRGTSSAIDLRYAAQQGNFALHVAASPGTAGTAGTTEFSYLLSTALDGTYAAPSTATAIGTCGTANSNDVMGFEPEMMPFIKIVAAQTGSGSAGNDSLITAELITQ